MKAILFICLMLHGQLLFCQGKFFGGDGDGFAVATITNVILPVRIIDFSVQQHANNLKATLVLATGSTACRVLLQYSADGNLFKNVDSLLLLPGNSLQLTQILVDSIRAGAIRYYRAGVTACDGMQVYSKTVVLRRQMAGNSGYYSGIDKVFHYTTTVDEYLQVSNAAGQVILKRMITAGAGTVPLAFLAPGIYYYRMGALISGKMFVR